MCVCEMFMAMIVFVTYSKVDPPHCKKLNIWANISSAFILCLIFPLGDRLLLYLFIGTVLLKDLNCNYKETIIPL